MSNRYEYLIEYAFDGGSGRSFTTTYAPINSADLVRTLDRSLQADLPQLRNLNIRSFQLLREYNDE
jgi:hypothetical protein